MYTDAFFSMYLRFKSILLLARKKSNRWKNYEEALVKSSKKLGKDCVFCQLI